MERQQFIELVRSQLSRHESDTMQEQSRCGSIDALEQLWKILESQEDEPAADEEIAEYECD